MLTRIVFTAFTFLTFCSAAASHAEEGVPPSFANWVTGLREEALAAGVNPDLFDETFETVTPLEDVIALDQKQPEKKLSFSEYLEKTVTAKRIERGEAALDAQRKALKRIEERYGVPSNVLVALWGKETEYGRNTGNFQVIDALATLAWEGRRAEFFKKELIQALLILQEENLSSLSLEGSWAGAMGQCQFMPSTFRKYAVDGDGDGRRDIWNSTEDALTSMAHYLSELGWKKGEGWGFRARLPDGFDLALASLEAGKPYAEWQKLGVSAITPLRAEEPKTTLYLVLPGDNELEGAYLVTENYKHLLEWNRSRYFATAVGLLSDALAPSTAQSFLRKEKDAHEPALP